MGHDLMRVLLLIHGFNALSQRVFVELEQMGHEVSIEFDINDANTLSAIEDFQPHVILAPYLKRAIADQVWRNHLCLILHPGPPGDRGASSLDWAILEGKAKWGVTLLQADEEMDAGPIWQTCEFQMPQDTKSAIYRNDVTEATVKVIRRCFADLEKAGPKRKIAHDAKPLQAIKPVVRQSDRAINWASDDTETVLRKIRSADGVPGLATTVCGRQLYLYDAHIAHGRHGSPGEVVATSGPAICIATRNGAIWVGHLRDTNAKHPFKLPAKMVLGEKLKGIRETKPDTADGYREIRYVRDGSVGHLYFELYNGAMSSDQCERLLAAYNAALKQDTRVIVLHGGRNFWSNGMHLNVIEAAPSPADESWRNINAIDDLAEAIIRTQSQITIAALQGNAGAGGVFLARACDQMWVRKGVILNPHYKDMGNLYGSEFWTYLLPRHAGVQNTDRIARQRLPMGSREAVELGLADDRFGEGPEDFKTLVAEKALTLADTAAFKELRQEKLRRRKADEVEKPLAQYRAEELEMMKHNFYGFDPSYHVARYNFVYKVPKSRTPVTLARHRDLRSWSGGLEQERKAS